MAQSRTRIIIVTICVAIAAGAMALVYGLYEFGRAFEPITDVRRYDELRGAWSAMLVSHFPKSIPADASDVRFYQSQHFPGQGGSQMQLRCTLPRGRIAELTRGLTPSPTMAKFPSSEIADYTSRPQPSLISAKWNLCILDAQPSVVRNGNPDWNHGIHRGYAIANDSETIVFWVDAF